MITYRNINSNYFKNFIAYRYFAYKTIKRPNQNIRIKKTVPSKSDISKKTISLANQLKARILSTGPISVADYMREALTNPSGGYYMQRDVFGSQGDFITSPEILQIFGELIAIWCITEWKKLGSPSPLQIIELGPGRGTLARDILRVLSHFKLNTDISLHLVEVSPILSEIQAQKLCYHHEEVDESKTVYPFYKRGESATGINVFWYRNIEQVPSAFSIILANEFFDALPIHKFQKHEGIWKEILIDIDDTNKFRFVISKSQTPNSKIYRHIECDNRECLEYSFETARFIDILATRLEENGGLTLIIDYGHSGEKTDTFRAFKNHELHDPLIDPGLADLTADVDFSHIKYRAENNGKLLTLGPVEQGTFLKNMQSDARLNILLENCLPEQEEQIKSGYDMLINPDQMGKRFKFFAMFPAVLKDYLGQLKISGFR